MRVRVNGTLGFKKENINEPIFDMFEYLIDQLGHALGINTVNTYFFDDGARRWFDSSITDRLPHRLNKMNLFFSPKSKEEKDPNKHI